MRKSILASALFSLIFILGNGEVIAQTENIDAPLLTFTRGKLWHSLFFAKSGPGSFSNWAKNGIGWDWPGFDATKIKEDIDGSPSYMAAGGLYVGCKKDRDSVLGVEEWAMYAGSVSNEPTSKYIIKKHKKYSDNHGMQKRNSGGEEIIETQWEYNPQFPSTYEPQRQLPLRVTRKAHQWNGSMRDENYIIYEYTIKNISRELAAYKESRKVADTLYDFYAMFSYAIHANSRSWTIFYPNLTPGARNTTFIVDTLKKDFYTGKERAMVFARANDYREDPNSSAPPKTMAFAYSSVSGQKLKDSKTGAVKPSGEWLAPGFAGIRLLYSTPDKLRKAPGKINKIAWSAVENNQDLAGPVTGKNGVPETFYSVLKDPANAFNAVTSTVDPLMGGRRLWTMMSVGPWDLAPGDSVVIAIAEIVDGIDYAKCTGTDQYTSKDVSTVNQLGRDLFEKTSDKAKFTYDNGMRHPNPPLAPVFNVNFFKGKDNFVANEVTWSDQNESMTDPDDGIADLAGYRLYRSDYLPVGPWKKVADISKRDIKYYQNGQYTFVDSSVEIGTAYYYALTAYDNGRSSWSVNPAVIFNETRTVNVPPLESSIFANRLTYPFVATLAPPSSLDNILVVPNPFVIGEGSAQPGDSDVIQFVNIPNPCTIRIYSVRGDLIKTLKAEEGTGAILSWNQATDYGQFVTSGVYVFHVESPLGNKIGKFAIVR